jgi:hypothetical protein
VTPTEIAGRCHHCVTILSLTVSDLLGLCKGYRAIPAGSTEPVRPEGAPLCWFGFRPLCWGSPQRRADTVTAAKAVGAPIV